MEQIVECVPNFSEGRRPDIIRQIVEAMRAVPAARVLDVQSDVDHNRTVVTMVGSPLALENAAFQGIAAAARLINMNEHQGGHPRIGAADVVPFVPVRGASLEDCAQIARRLGRRVGNELDIPVYLYEAAAARPDRVNLADVRRGEFEGLSAEIETNPDRTPDFGPAHLGSAGATVIGARPFLIAFNTYLDSGDIDIARRIARAIRHSSGGLRYVKAMGLLVDGQAQVSMNLVDFEQTPIYRVLEMIRREAAQAGVGVSRCELVGLVPQRALVDAAAWYLQLDVNPDQILENRLHQEPDLAPTSFLDAVADETPAPGGGSVAALAGALAAALGAMVARLTIGRKKYEAVRREMETLLVEAEQLRAELTSGIARDAAAYDRVVLAYRMPKGSEQERATRERATQDALIHAAEVPLDTARGAVRAAELANSAARLGNSNAITDAGTAAHLARAAFEGAVLNVRVNAAQVSDRAQATAWLQQIEQLRDRLIPVHENTLATIEEQWTKK